MDGLRDRRQQKHARKVASTRGVEDGAVDKIDGVHRLAQVELRLQQQPVGIEIVGRLIVVLDLQVAAGARLGASQVPAASMPARTSSFCRGRATATS